MNSASQSPTPARRNDSIQTSSSSAPGRAALVSSQWAYLKIHQYKASSPPVAGARGTRSASPCLASRATGAISWFLCRVAKKQAKAVCSPLADGRRLQGSCASHRFNVAKSSSFSCAALCSHFSPKQKKSIASSLLLHFLHGLFTSSLRYWY